MLLLLFLLSSECGAQYYVPLAYRRAPSPMEALERLRSPPSRYLPQVDYSEEYALPPQWTNDEYEYDNFSPVYRQEDPEEAYNELMRSYLMEQQQVQRRSDVTPPPPTTSSPPPPQVTGIPPSPEKKSVQSMVVADPPHSAPSEGEGGQKEEPLFRPQQTSQRTTAWNTPPHKTPIPLLKQMIQGGGGGGGQQKDILLEELNSLKKV